jgi:hypothetical protein
MISLIICHRNKTFLDTISKSIENTIGVAYQLIVVDNTKNDYTIFTAYNYGVTQAKFNILCFVHEDIIFHTNNWGQHIVNHFKDESIGLVGVIGATTYPQSPSPWWSSIILNDHLVNNIQHWHGKVSDTHYHTILSKTDTLTVTKDYNNPQNKNVINATVVDGLFYCIEKKLFDEHKIRYDDLNFKGFHCYDTDISLQVNQFKKVVVVYDIVVEHLQTGTLNKDWYDACITLNKKWRSTLPLFKKEIDESKYWLYEWTCLQTFVYWMHSVNYTKTEIREVIKDVSENFKYDEASKKIAVKLINWGRYGETVARILNLKNKFLV